MKEPTLKKTYFFSKGYHQLAPESIIKRNFLLFMSDMVIEDNVIVKSTNPKMLMKKLTTDELSKLVEDYDGMVVLKKY